ncbi:MAG: tetratricopeptide repeat protein [Prevotellaceae bacterium]|jgi:hypothetical protein|nr:tetratricopeptide repeat protein [Prevotellaceae bacterium]
MSTDQLIRWIEHPEVLDKETLYELRTQIARYPYYTSLRLLLLRNLYLLHDDTFAAELHKTSVYAHDRRVLLRWIEGEQTRLSAQLPNISDAETEENGTIDRTLTLIDRFLQTDTSGESVAHWPAGMATADYADTLLSEPVISPDTHDIPPNKTHRQALIDTFLSKANETIRKELPVEESSTNESHREDVNLPDEIVDDDAYFTETLAKICIKQHRYERALEIIKKLSIKYPKKNAYFADQIRFLEKLIINANSK